MASKLISRRDALKAGAVITPFFRASSGAARTYQANEKIRLAVIACGGRGRDGISAGLREHMVTMCDVDPTAGRETDKHIARAREGFPDAKLFTDLRKLFDARLDLDAVWVATPDHNHFPAAYRAIAAGLAVSGSWMKSVRLVPESFQEEVGRPEKMIPRVSSIAGDFFNCIRNGGQPCSNFVYAGRLTEIMHLGNIAARVGEKLTYNFKTGTFVNSPKADSLLTRKPRQGWEFGYV